MVLFDLFRNYLNSLIGNNQEFEKLLAAKDISGVKDKMTSKIKENGHWFWVILGGVVLIFIIVIVIKVARKITTILSIIPDRKDKNKNHKRE